MKLDSVAVTPKRFSRQVAAYEAAGLDPNMVVNVPFVANTNLFFNTEALLAIGVDPSGLAKQLDQDVVETIANNLAAKAKKAVAAGQPLPAQEDVDIIAQRFNFAGLRQVSEENLSTQERVVVSEIKKALRRAIGTLGYLASLDATGNPTKDSNAVVFSVSRIQTGPEAKENTPLPAGTLSLEDFDLLVSGAYQQTSVTVTDDQGRIGVLDFSGEAVFDDHGRPANWPAIIEDARREAARIIERNRTRGAITRPAGFNPSN